VIFFDEIVTGITVVVMHDSSAEEGDVRKSWEGMRETPVSSSFTVFVLACNLCGLKFMEAGK
jgi:hypothetical protein